MAKQKGLIKIEGVVGDMNYYRSKDGYLAREKTSLNASRIASDPKFQRTRENMAEFGAAAKAGKLMRHSINTLLKNAKDGRIVARLTQSMAKVLRTDAKSARGERTVSNGNLSLLKGFQFNETAVLGETLYAPYTTAIDRTAGTLTVNLVSFTSSGAIVAPEGATHYQLVSGGAELDFTAETYNRDVQQTKLLPWDETDSGDISLVNTITANSTLPLFLFLGIQFYQQVNSFQYPLKNGSFNALSLIDVNVP